MSKPTYEDTLPQSPADSHGETPPARKRAAKKAVATSEAPKTEPKKVAAVKKVAAKKVVAKKVAKKAVMADAEASGADTMPAEQPSKPATKRPRAKKSVPPPQETQEPADRHHDAAPQEPAPPEKPKLFGRVPGGGPVVAREAGSNDRPASTVSVSASDVRPPGVVPASSPPSDDRPPQIRHPQVRAPHNREGRTREGQNREGQNREGQNREGQNREGQNREGQNREGQNREGQNREGQNREGQNREGQNREGQPSRSKRRRDKRKNRNERQPQGQGQGQPPGQTHGRRPDMGRAEGADPTGGESHDRRAAPMVGPKIAADGLLELTPKGFGFLRLPGNNYEQLRDDVFVTPELIRRHNLRLGQRIDGFYQNGPRGPQVVEITTVNGMPPEEAAKLPHFDELKAINPTRRISFETTPERFTTRVVDIMAPVGRGQRGLIVSPPRSGKTTLLLHMAEAIREKYEDTVHLMVLLVDERPEEVTEFRRALPGAEIYASSNDEQPRNHCRIAELAIERAKRLVEAGKDVFLLMDSITRLARAYNNTMNNHGRGTGSGGITIGALEVPRRLFAAARNTRGGGSLTILATALIQTNSRADEAIYMEFKGTGNMELVLDRKIAENYIYPAADIFKSGTRREELLIPDHMLHKIHLIRRGLAGHRPVEAMERLLFFLKKFSNNPQMLLEIKG